MTDIKTEVERYAKGAIEDDARTLHRAMTQGIITRKDAEHYGLDIKAAEEMGDELDWIDLLNVMALEVYGRATVRPGQSPLIEQIVVVTGTGGPHVEFEVDMDDNVTGRAIWGSDSAEKFDTLPGLFDALAPLVGEEA